MLVMVSCRNRVPNFLHQRPIVWGPFTKINTNDSKNVGVCGRFIYLSSNQDIPPPKKQPIPQFISAACMSQIMSSKSFLNSHYEQGFIVVVSFTLEKCTLCLMLEVRQAFKKLVQCISGNSLTLRYHTDGKKKVFKSNCDTDGAMIKHM